MSTRWLVPVCCLLSTQVAHADQHAEGRYEASIAGAADSTGAGMAVASLGGAGTYVASVDDGDGEPAYLISIDVAVTARRLTGVVDASTLSTRASLAFGPAPLPVSNQDRGRAVSFPLSAELEHEGDLAALPRLSDRPDVRRAPYLRQRLALATRGLRAEYAEDGLPEEGLAGQPSDRETGALDLLAARASIAVTEQDGRRVDGVASVGLFGVVLRHPEHVVGEILALERHVGRSSAGHVSTVDTVWILRAHAVNPRTGSGYSMSWGIVFGSRGDQAPRPQVRDHRERHIGSVGSVTDTSRPHGVGAQYRRDAYITMAGEPGLDDRAWVEAWGDVGATRLVGRAWAAWTRRLTEVDPSGERSGGIEVGATRRYRRLDVGVRTEVGRSFYAALDGMDPTLPGLVARGTLTVAHASARRWPR
jgi:hypothetical protein